MTALMRTAQCGHLKVVKVLVENDAILDIKCKVRFFLHNWCCTSTYSKVVMLLVYAYIFIRPSCRREKLPSCMQYKEEGTKRWSRNSAQQEQIRPLKTRWGCRIIVGNVHTYNSSLHVYEQSMNYITCCAEFSDNTGDTCYRMEVLVKWLLAC